MTTYSATDLDSSPLHTGPYGNAFSKDGSYTCAALANADIVKLVRIPAGTRVDEVVIQHDEIDSNGTPTLTGKVGYTPVNSTNGPTADDDYWFASAAIGQSKAAVQCAAQPITFEYDVWLIFTATAAIATLATTAVLTAVVKGQCLGVK